MKTFVRKNKNEFIKSFFDNISFFKNPRAGNDSLNKLKNALRGVLPREKIPDMSDHFSDLYSESRAEFQRISGKNEILKNLNRNSK